MSKEGALFVIDNLHVSVEGKEIVKGLNLTIERGEIHAIMGPNASGKSTLAHALMGHPRYEITKGTVLLKGESIVGLKPDERARRGLFLGFQYPVAIPGVTVMNFLRSAVRARLGPDHPELINFRKNLKEKFELLSMDQAFATRYVNDGFSGGEKKRLEILQMSMLSPAMALLDETDSGLDIDALKIVARGINAVCGPDAGLLLVTHYQRLLDYVKPDYVHILMGGRIVKSGGPDLALKLEEGGYDPISAGLTRD